MMSTRSLRKRKKIFIDPAVQGAIVRQALIHWIVGIMVAGLCMLMAQLMQEGLQRTLLDHLSGMWTRYGIVVIAMLCLFPLFAYDSVRLSHRFTGPIYSLRVALKRLADGQNIPKVAFRKDDYWADLARDVNRIANRLNQQQSNNTENRETTDATPEPSAAEA